MNDQNEDIIFPKGQQIISPNFIGNPWLQTLVPGDNGFNCPIYNVTFEPGVRNSWHKHPGGQILLITDGTGYYQEKGKPIQTIKKGDVILIGNNVEHWHGSTPITSMTHLAISTNLQNGDVEWLEPVTDEIFNSLN